MIRHLINIHNVHNYGILMSQPVMHSVKSVTAVLQIQFDTGNPAALCVL